MVDRADVLDDGGYCRHRKCRLGLYYLVGNECRSKQKKYLREIDESQVWFGDCHGCLTRQESAILGVEDCINSNRTSDNIHI